jgi:hypothetical protein
MFWKFFNREKEITLDDVVPLHPEEYPARRLRQRLVADRERMLETQGAAAVRYPGISGHL